jgi:2,3-bisphosphoglycerate-dependent phosphoglycerate mutase
VPNPDPSDQTRQRSPLDAAFLTDVSDATELVLVRHGQQDIPGFGTGPIGDHIDAPLSSIGKQQAELVGRRFATERVDVVYASNLSRAYDTAAAIAGHHGLTPIVDTDLREIEIFRDIDPSAAPLDVLGRQRLLGIRARMQREQRWDVYPLSEGSAEFRGRVVNAIEGILAEHRGQRIVIGCHGGVIATYLGWVLGIDRDMWFRPAHTSVHVLRAKDLVRAVQSTNDVHHLRNADPALVTH